MFCKYCGEQLEPDILFCPYCGKPVSVKQTAVNEVITPAPALPEEPAYATSVQSVPAAAHAPKPRKKTGLIVAASLIAAAAVITGIWFFIDRSSRTEEYLPVERTFSGGMHYLYEYDRNGNMTKSTITIPTGNTAGDVKNVFINTYNRKDQLVKQVVTTHYGDEFVGSTETVYSYDSHGYLVSENVTNRDIDGKPTTYSISYKNDAQGNKLTERPDNQPDGYHLSSYYYTYDSNGNCVQEDSIYEKNGAPEPVSRTYREYDNNGNLTRELVYNYNPDTRDYTDFSSDTENQYNEHGDITLSIVQNNEFPEKSGTFRYENEYDEHGNLIKTTNLDDGKTQTYRYEKFRVKKDKAKN